MSMRLHKIGRLKEVVFFIKISSNIYTQETGELKTLPLKSVFKVFYNIIMTLIFIFNSTYIAWLPFVLNPICQKRTKIYFLCTKLLCMYMYIFTRYEEKLNLFQYDYARILRLPFAISPINPSV